jgi:GR25 family glycosyltransferase involved in LPS biosynthesis
MDKNKSASKLKGFGPLYVINLDGQPDRWEWMRNQLEYWELDYSRISAYDGREDDLGDIIKGKYPEMMNGMITLIVPMRLSWKMTVT